MFEVLVDTKKAMSFKYISNIMDFWIPKANTCHLSVMRVPTEHLVLLEHLPHLGHKDPVGLEGILPLKAAKKKQV